MGSEKEGPRPRVTARLKRLPVARSCPQWATPQIQTTSFSAPDALTGDRPWKEAVAPARYSPGSLGHANYRSDSEHLHHRPDISDRLLGIDRADRCHGRLGKRGGQH